VTDREDRSIAMRHAYRLSLKNTAAPAVSVVSRPPRICPDCGETIINRGAHWERCTGPRAYGQCECRAGWLHEPGCWLVTGGDAA
jgi:hypothetical protein